jgi:hypothetical protein
MSRGEFIPFIPASTVVAVNAPWNALFAAGIPPNTGIIGRCVPTPLPDGDQLFPYRIVLSGPAQARPGEEVTYRLEYERVSEGPGGEIVLEYGGTPSAPGVSLTSIHAVDGPGFADLGAQLPGSSERIALEGDAGALEVTIRLHPDFVGDAVLSFYVPGTTILEPPGTIAYVHTEVAP